MPLIPSQRHLFDIPENVAYFNCAYNSPQLNESRIRLLSGVAEKSSPWKRAPESFFKDAETVRALAADAFGGSVDGYAIVPAASYGVSTAARVIEPCLKAGDGIVVIAEEFPSNVLPWRRVAHETGAVVRTIASPEDSDWTRAILDRLDRRTKVVAISSCHWTSGARIDLIPIGKACRDLNCLLVVDASQTLGVLPFAIDDVQPDFLIAAGYKCLLGPYGFSLLYVAERWHDARPLEESWLARSNAENFAALANYSDRYLPGARRFDVGQKCTTTILPGAIAALEQIKAWGVQNIAASLSRISSQIAQHLQVLGFQVVPEVRRCPHMFGAYLPSGYPPSAVARLIAADIYISQRGNALRFAPHLHVNQHDVGRLLDALSELIK